MDQQQTPSVLEHVSFFTNNIHSPRPEQMKTKQRSMHITLHRRQTKHDEVASTHATGGRRNRELKNKQQRLPYYSAILEPEPTRKI